MMSAKDCVFVSISFSTPCGSSDSSHDSREVEQALRLELPTFLNLLPMHIDKAHSIMIVYTVGITATRNAKGNETQPPGCEQEILPSCYTILVLEIL